MLTDTSTNSPPVRPHTFSGHPEAAPRPENKRLQKEGATYQSKTVRHHAHKRPALPVGNFLGANPSTTTGLDLIQCKPMAPCPFTPCDYTRYPEQLHSDLEQYLGGELGIDSLAANIEHSAKQLLQAEPKGSDDRFCFQKYYMDLLQTSKYFKFKREQFPVLIKLKREMSTKNNAVLLPLASAIAHSFVLDVSNSKYVSPRLMDYLRKDQSEDVKQKTETLIRRKNYLLADTTPECQLHSINQKPSLINRMTHSKREWSNPLKSFQEQVKTGLIPETQETRLANDKVHNLLTNHKLRQNDYDFHQTIEDVCQILTNLLLDVPDAVPHNDWNLFQKFKYLTLMASTLNTPLMAKKSLMTKTSSMTDTSSPIETSTAADSILLANRSRVSDTKMSWSTTGGLPITADSFPPQQKEKRRT